MLLPYVATSNILYGNTNFLGQSWTINIWMYNVLTGGL